MSEPELKPVSVDTPTLSKREQNRERTREALLKAAAVIIAESGFAAATLTRITERADVALGTFYNYFDSTEALFAELVVGSGRRLRDAVRAAMPLDGDFFAREEAAFREWFRFLHQHPFFLRVLNEAEIFCPEAFEAYFQAITQGYRKVLASAAKKGEIRQLDRVEIETVSLMLMAQRSFYGLRLQKFINKNGAIDNRVVTVYLDLLRRVLLN
ncbi:TetR/AcrR family transcriptional regulator [Cupriavidus basilensis]